VARRDQAPSRALSCKRSHAESLGQRQCIDRAAGSNIGLLGSHVLRARPFGNQHIAVMVDLGARLDGSAERKGRRLALPTTVLVEVHLGST